MKKLIYLLLLSGLFIISGCKGDGSKDQAKDDATEEKDTKKASSGNECDDYLANYAEWVEGYLVFLKEMGDNPGDMALASKAMEWTEEAMKWAEDYSALTDCITDPEFTTKYMEIVEQINKAAAELYEEP